MFIYKQIILISAVLNFAFKTTKEQKK